MIRKIIQINEEKCNGCGACASACHEGAIGMVGGKARLLRDDYCDGLGDCLPACPTGAITFVEREADAYNEAAVEQNKMNRQGDKLPCGCPGTQSRRISHNGGHSCSGSDGAAQSGTGGSEPAQSRPSRASSMEPVRSELSQWPVQIKLVPVNAPYFDGANLLVAADCTAYAYGDFHNKFIKNRITLIGCPKLDDGNYADKLTAIIRENNIRSVTVVRMEVPCCGGIENAVKTALQNSGKFIPWQVVTVTTDGNLIE